MPGKIRIGTLFALGLLVAAGCCESNIRKGDQMNSDTENTVLSEMDTNKLNGFFAADPKYNPSPIPTTLPIEAVRTYIKPKLALYPSGLELNKFSQLTVFYNLNELEEAFFERMQKNKELSRDKHVSAACIITLLWISQEPQRMQQLLSEYKILLQKLSFPDDIELAIRVCNAFSSQQTLDLLKSALQIQSGTLKQQIQTIENQSNDGQREMLQSQLEQIQDLLNNEIAELEQNIQERDKIQSLTKPEEQIPPMVKLYMGNNENQKDWSGIKLLRIAESDEQNKSFIASQFLNLSQTYVVDELRYEELEKKYQENSEGKLDDIEYARLYGAVLKRQRCLYAAEFFKSTLDSTQSTWLKKQDDDGTNLLALRPDWKYPVSGEE